jgi:hypothetical protein
MTSSIGLSAAFVNGIVLLGLAAAVVSPRLSRLVRLMISTFAFACAWMITAVFDAMRAPDWTIFMGGAVIVVSIVVVIATLHRWTQAGDGGETRPGHRGDEGGGGPRRHWPDAPEPGGGDSDPSWWPEFERRLSLYVAEREGENRPPVVLPAKSGLPPPNNQRIETRRPPHRSGSSGRSTRSENG